MSFDTLEENRAFAEKFSFPYLLLCDTGRELGVRYGACDDASAANARRISVLIGPDGTVCRAYEQVNPKRHPAQVLEDLAALVA